MAKEFLKETMEPQILVGNTDDVTRLGKKNQSPILVKFTSLVRKLKNVEKQKIDEFRDQKR